MNQESGHPDERVYVVLGATGGIGSELCRQLATRGGRLLLAARDGEKLARLAESLGGRARTADATRPDEVEACVDAAMAEFGRMDGIANCVGSLLLKPAHRTSHAEWDAVIAANLGTAFAAVRAGARVMQSGGGSIVLVSSAAARVGLANHEAIAAAKAGVIGLALAAAASYGSRGIRVNCVAPGLVRTPLTQSITSNEASLKASEAMHALGRIGEAAEVAGVMAWLLGDESRWVTGQVFGVDGGLSTVRARRAG